MIGSTRRSRSFVLNHIDDPVGGLGELVRTLRPGGGVLATVFANSSQSANRDAVDQVAVSTVGILPTGIASSRRPPRRSSGTLTS